MTPAQAKALALNGMAFQRLSKFEKSLKDVTDIQCSNGNWNYDPYMMGMANGLILARAILTGEEAVFMSTPEEWLRDRHCDPEVTTPEHEAQLLLAEVR